MSGPSAHHPGLYPAGSGSWGWGGAHSGGPSLSGTTLTRSTSGVSGTTVRSLPTALSAVAAQDTNAPCVMAPGAKGSGGGSWTWVGFGRWLHSRPALQPAGDCCTERPHARPDGRVQLPLFGHCTCAEPRRPSREEVNVAKWDALLAPGPALSHTQSVRGRCLRGTSVGASLHTVVPAGVTYPPRGPLPMWLSCSHLPPTAHYPFGCHAGGWGCP
jgi:hypothetical protein